jgi:hypothetical protein
MTRLGGLILVGALAGLDLVYHLLVRPHVKDWL